MSNSVADSLSLSLSLSLSIYLSLALALSPFLFNLTTAICEKVCPYNETLESVNGISDNFSPEKWLPASIWRPQEEALQPFYPGIPRSKEAVYSEYKGHWKCSFTSRQWSRKGYRLLQPDINSTWAELSCHKKGVTGKDCEKTIILIVLFKKNDFFFQLFFYQ